MHLVFFFFFNYNVLWVKVLEEMQKKDVINFAPTGEKKKKHIPGYVKITVFLCIAAFFISVFVMLAVNDFDLGKALGAREAVTENEEETTESTAVTDVNIELTEAVNFLVFCTDKNELTFSQLISVDAAARKVRIKPIALDYGLVFPTGEKTLSQAVKTESGSNICFAFSEKSVNVEKYVFVTEDNFKRLMSHLGAVPVQINGSYEFNIDAVKYTFSPGVQNMTSDVLLKFMKYARQGEEALRIQGDVTASIFRQHFTLENFQKGESFFSELINLVDSNITAFDYGKAKDVLALLLSGETEVAVVS